jgi:transcriptional regulator with XRE-family HTH domain
MLTEKQIGRRIAAARELCDMNQGELATATGLHPSTISRLESGSVTLQFSHLAAISQATGFTIQYLIGEEDAATGAKRFEAEIYRDAKSIDTLPDDKKQLVRELLQVLQK